MQSFVDFIIYINVQVNHMIWFTNLSVCVCSLIRCDTYYCLSHFLSFKFFCYCLIPELLFTNLFYLFPCLSDDECKIIQGPTTKLDLLPFNGLYYT
jgi:hypothetical protein